MTITVPILTPIRFIDPSLEFDNETTFQNPDNRRSTSYDWENINEVPYALPIPKQWPDGQPGIDVLLNLEGASDVSEIYAKLYDEEGTEYKDIWIDLWMSTATAEVARIYLDCNSGTGVEDGYYTIRIYRTSDDELLLESEAILIADWFIDCIPFEYWNFENDFGIQFDSDILRWTGRIMAPIRLFDPEPRTEKEVYQNDPGVSTTLRSVPQRIFNFDSHPLPVHVVELIQMGFACSELYLDRIHINSDQEPEAELYQGTNLKYLNGKATFVDFNEHYRREIVETEQEDQSKDWGDATYASFTITGNSIEINEASCASQRVAYTESVNYSENDLFLIKLILTDDAGDSDLPKVLIGTNLAVTITEWGINWISFRMNSDGPENIYILNAAGEKAVFTAVIDVYKIT